MDDSWQRSGPDTFGAIMNEEQANKAIIVGAIAACISGVFTVLIAMRSTAANNPASMVDAVLLFALAFGVFKRSRAAAVSLFVYLLMGKLIVLVQTGKVPGVLFSLVFLVLYARAIAGTYALRKIWRTANPEAKTKRGWVHWLAVSGGIIGLTLVLFGMILESGLIATGDVQPGAELRPQWRTRLETEGVLRPGEPVVYFALELFTPEDMGTLLTDKRVITYSREDNGKLAIFAIHTQDLESVTKVDDSGTLSPSLYEVESAITVFPLELFAEGGLDVEFIDTLRRQKEEHRLPKLPDPPLTPPKAGILFQPEFDWNDGTHSANGTGFLIRWGTKILGVGSSHYILGDILPVKAQFTGIGSTTFLETTRAFGVVGDGDPRTPGPNEYRMGEDFFFLPIDAPVETDQVLELDDRDRPPHGERVWFPSKVPGGFELLEGRVVEASKGLVVIALDEAVVLRSQSGSPFISQQTGKVIGSFSGSFEDAKGRTFILLASAAALRAGLAMPRQEMALEAAARMEQGPADLKADEQP